MAYRIRFDGCGSTSACAWTKTDAPELANGLLKRGRKNVIISPAQWQDNATQSA